ncbi:hypothetical protein P3L10_012067 [Capsicum annuum]
MCVVYDRHESIIKAVSVVYPCIPHFACIWHLWNNVCTNYRKSKDKLTDEFFAMAKAYNLDIRESTNYIYGVYEEGRKYIVRLDIRTCNYGRFQLDEIPCTHAIAVLKSKHVKEMKSYCSDYYKKEALVKTYEMPLCLMSDKRD